MSTESVNKSERQRKCDCSNKVELGRQDTWSSNSYLIGHKHTWILNEIRKLSTFNDYFQVYDSDVHTANSMLLWAKQIDESNIDLNFK